MELWDLPFIWLPFFPLKTVHWNLGEAEIWRNRSEQTGLMLRVIPSGAFSPDMPMKLLLLALMQPVTQHCQG